jgi:hypothetical protein
VNRPVMFRDNIIYSFAVKSITTPAIHKYGLIIYYRHCHTAFGTPTIRSNRARGQVIPCFGAIRIISHQEQHSWVRYEYSIAHRRELFCVLQRILQVDVFATAAREAKIWKPNGDYCK